jgi:hypothetical protein
VRQGTNERMEANHGANAEGMRDRGEEIGNECRVEMQKTIALPTAEAEYCSASSTWT